MPVHNNGGSNCQRRQRRVFKSSWNLLPIRESGREQDDRLHTQCATVDIEQALLLFDLIGLFLAQLDDVLDCRHVEPG